MSPTCYQNALDRGKWNNPQQLPGTADTIGNHLIGDRSESLCEDAVQECPLLGSRASLRSQGYRSTWRSDPRRIFLLVCSIGTPELITRNQLRRAAGIIDAYFITNSKKAFLRKTAQTLANS